MTEGQSPEAFPDLLRRLLMDRREVLIIELGRIEDLLGLPRSIVPGRKRVRAELAFDNERKN